MTISKKFYKKINSKKQFDEFIIYKQFIDLQIITINVFSKIFSSNLLN